MAVPEHDDVGPREPAPHASRPPGRGAAVVDHPDRETGEIDHQRLREPRRERGVVVVPEHRVHRREPAQLIEQLRCDDVARVEHRVRPAELGVHRVGQPALAAGADVGVGEHDDAHPARR